MPLLRFDRLLTLGLFRPWMTLGLTGGKGRVPILMYHSISDEAENSVAPYFRVSTSPKMFAEQMALLKNNGYRAIGLEQARKLMRAPGTELRNLVVLTFDDGFQDFFTAAFPVLQKYDFSATMFLPTAFIGNESRRFKERNCLTWDEVRECRRGGIEFGSHTVNHPKLYELGFTEIREELENSKLKIEAELGEPVTTFAYPYAFPSADRDFVARFIETLKSTGYECNVTTRIGRAAAGDEPFTLRRLPVNSADDAAFFLAKLRGAYDWMTWPQDLLKAIKKLAKPGQTRKDAPISAQASIPGK
jgi:peptidoglycan/xylan/chitin deacetylase (PgdA/CDA1 family)